jgi:hypothetical protein
MRRRPLWWIVAIALDIEVSGLAEGTTIVVGPFQALRDLQDGQSLRAQAGK